MRSIHARRAAFCALILVGCTSQAPEQSAPSPARDVALAQLGHHAEDLYDRVVMDDWVAAEALIDSLRADANTGISRARSELDRQVGGSLERLGSALESREKSTALIESNRLTALSARLLVDSGTPVPTDVTLLDYFGRELAIHGDLGNDSEVSATVDSIDTVWMRLKPLVEGRNGADVAARFDSLVRVLDAAPSTAARTKLATPILDDVDHLEAAFATK